MNWKTIEYIEYIFLIFSKNRNYVANSAATYAFCGKTVF